MERRDARAAAGARWRRPSVHRIGWAVLDQAISSGATFCVTVVAARELSSEAFAAFGVAFVVYALALTVSRYVVAQPLMVRFGHSDQARSELAAAAGTTVGLGLLAGAVALAGAAVAGGGVGRAVAVVAIAMPALLVQDTWRCGFVTMGRPRLAVVNDAVWLAAQAATILAALTLQPTAVGFTVAWSLAGVVASVFGAAQGGARPRLSRAGAYVRRHADLMRPFAVEVMVVRAVPYVAFLALGPIVGALGIGALRAAQVLLGPFNVLLYGLSAAIVPEGGRVLRRDPRAFGAVLRVASLGCAAAALAWGAVVLGMPDGWGVALLGDMWPHAERLLPAGVAATVGTALAVGAVAGLGIRELAWARVRVQTLVGITTLVVVVASGLAGAVTGAAWGLAAGTWMSAAAAWWTLSAAQVAIAGSPVTPAGEARSV